MRILVVGATGFLGSYVYNSCRGNGVDVIGTSTRPSPPYVHLDITNPKQVTEAIENATPDCVINCAAMTSVDDCERDPALARTVNARGTDVLARACKTSRARLVYVSTDSVFDGRTGDYTEDSEPSPINVYAKTKVEGERLALQFAGDCVVVRTNFYGLNPNGRHLLNWIISSIQQKKAMVGFDDVVFNPLWVSDLSSLLVELATSKYQGIVHCAADEKFTKYEFIRKVILELGYGDSLLRRGSADQVKFSAPRPKTTTLANGLMHSLLKTKIRTLEVVLHDTSFDNYRKKKPEAV